MIFTQLNEKMRAMDRSLLEKVAADIEMMDDDQGIYIHYIYSTTYVYIKSHVIDVKVTF